VKSSTGGNDSFNVPLAIMQKATTVRANGSVLGGAVAQDPNLDGSNLQILPIFHFAEINKTNPNRRFNIYNNDVLMLSNFSPPPFQVESVYNSGQFHKNAFVFFRLNKTASSSLPPLINAFEAYSLVQMENLTTNFDDGKSYVYTVCALHSCHLYHSLDLMTIMQLSLFSWFNSTS
jgi:hypothetical protein